MAPKTPYGCTFTGRFVACRSAERRFMGCRILVLIYPSLLCRCEGHNDDPRSQLTSRPEGQCREKSPGGAEGAVPESAG